MGYNKTTFDSCVTVTGSREFSPLTEYRVQA